MKTKHLGRYIIALFLSLWLFIPSGLPALATSSSMDNKHHDFATVNGNSWYNPNGGGVRLTAVNATTGEDNRHITAALRKIRKRQDSDSV